MVSRQKEQLGGVLIFLAGIFLIYLSWSDALNNGSYLVKIAGVGPGFAVLGMGMILFTSYKRERISRGENITKISGLQLITIRWWTILGIGVIASLINLYLLGYFNSF